MLGNKRVKLFLTKEEDLCGWGRWGCFLTQTGGCWLGGNCREIAGRVRNEERVQLGKCALNSRWSKGCDLENVR